MADEEETVLLKDEEFQRFAVQPSKVGGLQNINPALTIFAFRYEGLWLVQSQRDLNLGQASRLSGLPQPAQKCLIARNPG